jgi:hypothetical protein
LTPERGFECQRLRPEEIRDGRLAEFEVLATCETEIAAK